MPAPHAEHGAHVRSWNGLHGPASQLPTSHGGAQAAHVVSVVAVHGVCANCPGTQVVQAAHVVPEPVNPGRQVHSAPAPTSTHWAFGLQPPLSITHAPVPPGTQPASMQLDPAAQAWPHPPQLASSLPRSKQPLGHATRGGSHDTKVGCGEHAASAAAAAAAHDRRATRTGASVTQPGAAPAPRRPRT